MSPLFFALLAAALAWFTYDSLAARERTLKACQRACKQLDLQMLDQSIALTRLRLRRNHNGRLALDRCYRFEFSLLGDDRWPGQVQLLGQRIESVQLEHPEGLIIIDKGQVVG